jgi:hypothetical protein
LAQVDPATLTNFAPTLQVVAESAKVDPGIFPLPSETLPASAIAALRVMVIRTYIITRKLIFDISNQEYKYK